MKSGLYQRLVDRGWLVRHAEVKLLKTDGYKTLQPETVPFISYPYEWCFSQLREAALLTLQIQELALAHGLSLKDASAYNIQFRGARPVLIDTLSFEKYQTNQPWVAYRQFCQHFLAPLALVAKTDHRLGQLLRVYIDGLPLDLATRLLPRRALLQPGLGLHLYFHARSRDRGGGEAQPQLPLHRQSALLESLKSVVTKLRYRPAGGVWGDYYDQHSYSSASFEGKERLVTDFLDRVKPASIWDLGANTGHFSRLAGEANTTSFDHDHATVEANYLATKKEGTERLLPLVMDLTNPSPSLGWASRERPSLTERGPADLVMALALVHHLAIAANVPLPDLADYLAELGGWLIIEFVPKSDPMVQRLLANRRDIFDDYDQAGFEAAFGRRFATIERRQLPDSERTLYLMKTKPA